MFDADTVELIANAPPLEGLDLTRLPQELTEVYAQIVTARIRLRGLPSDGSLPGDITEAISTMRRVASAHEAFVSALPKRQDRSAAAFVAASAHHVCMLADSVRIGASLRTSSLGIEAVSAEISAALLFLIAEASADAAEMAKQIRPANGDPVETGLLNAISDLATGRLERIVGSSIPNADVLLVGQPGQVATRSLYFLLLKGMHALAQEMLDAVPADTGPSALEIFDRVITLSIEPLDGVFGAETTIPYNIFSGPLHLASLLSAVARDFPSSALVNVTPPDGVDGIRWLTLMKQMAKQRPYVWRNHREAIDSGYLETGISAAVSFPTGGGKSKLAELKIAAALLRGSKVIFLAPTLALVDQTATALAKTFPQNQIERERAEELLFTAAEVEPLPGISVFTPERCLSMLSFAPDVFVDVGLLVFDECHLLHPRDLDTSRRSVDAMLCLLNLTASAPDADILLLSAMMKNTSEIAAWVQDLTGRPCLALDLKWKPTRQVRGCVVYAAERLNELKARLTQTRRSVANINPPASLKRELTAHPFGFFCLRQTWVSNARIDYSLQPLLDEAITLSTGTRRDRNWYLTPNGNQVSAALGTATARQNLKTLIFTQTIPLCKSTSDTVNEAFGPGNIHLLPEEIQLYRMAADEFGGAEHLYLTVSGDGTLNDASACHHGLLILQERHLHESLFRRADGVNVLVATSTLAQGMNLPSEVVIIAGDSRFDPTANRMERLEAHELLNAAGRAGRAGEVSQGFVLIVPSKVVDFQSSTNQIHSHWADLQTIFSQSDQCLEIDDPFTGLLDQIHASAAALTPAAQYLLSRLPVGAATEEGGVDAPARRLLSRSFGAYRAKLRNDANWIASRTEAAVQLRNADPDITHSWIDQVAAASGISARILMRLTQDLAATAGATAPIPNAWRDWMLAWLRNNPADLPVLIRPESLEGMFGTVYKKLPDEQAKGLFAVAAFEQLLPLWMQGATLATLEQTLGTPVGRLGRCEKAREFVLRIVPELAYVYSLLPQLYATLFLMHTETPVALVTIGAAVREGCDSPEKIALRQIRGGRLNRVAVHRQYAQIVPYVAPAQPAESFSDVLNRVRAAADLFDLVQ
jgi:superfamily II DNA/RNA helicase